MIELIGESLSGKRSRFLFAYLPTKDMPSKYKNIRDYRISFVYEKIKEEENVLGYALLGSVLAHNPYWSTSSTIFSNEELERIALLQVSAAVLPSSYKRDVAIVPIKERMTKNGKDFIFAYIREGEDVMNWGFLYSEQDNIRYGDCLVKSILIYQSNPIWEDIRTEFSNEKLDNIRKLKITGRYK